MAQIRKRLGLGHDFFKSNPHPEKLMDNICLKLKRCWQLDVGENPMFVTVYKMDTYLGSVSYVSIDMKPVSVLAADATGKSILTDAIQEFFDKELWR